MEPGDSDPGQRRRANRPATRRAEAPKAGQAAPVLPRIWQTDIPKELAAALRNPKGPQLITVQAPTGEGKTVMAISELAKLHHEAGGSIDCCALMPYRVSVKEMHRYLPRLFPSLHFGFGMRGDVSLSPRDNCRLYTVGYWLEIFLSSLKAQESFAERRSLFILLDEQHDSSWQTDLALRLLLWAQRLGWPLRIVLASATLNVALDTLPQSRLLLQAPEELVANVEIHYLESEISPLEKGKLCATVLREMMEALLQIVEEYATGDVLILLPGQEEIDKLVGAIEQDPKLEGCEIHILHSQLSREDQAMALQPSLQRKVIVATNIVENAITIRGLCHVIDCGVRKVNRIAPDGISQLVSELAAQSNLKQAAGRVGREGATGHCWRMMSPMDFHRRKPFADSEVHSNPLYLQIIKLVKERLPLEDILNHVPPQRLLTDCRFLIKHGALELVAPEPGSAERSEEPLQEFVHSSQVRVSPVGEIMAHLHLSIRAGHFVSYVMRNLPACENLLLLNGNDHNGREVDLHLWYTTCVLAAWMDSSSSLFYRPLKKAWETTDEYQAKLSVLRENSSEFYEVDCAQTMLNVWFSSWAREDGSTNGFYAWCKQNGVFDRTLREIQQDVDHTVASLAKLGFVVPIPTLEECAAMQDDVSLLMNRLTPAIQIAFYDWIFNWSNWDNSYKPAHMGGGDRYILDRSVVNDGRLLQRLAALTLRRISPKVIAMSKIIKL